MMVGKNLSGVRIGIMGKGGAGKSTLMAMLAQTMQDNGYQVCVIDADSTNFGLAASMGMDAPEKTLMDYFGGMVFSGGKVSCPVDDPTPLKDSQIQISNLSKKYYSKSQSGIIILSAGKMGEQGPGAGCDGPVAKIARDLVVQIENEHLVTLLDFKAGIEDSARGVLTKLDYVVVVVDPTLASVEIASDMSLLVDKIKADELPATAHLENPKLVEIANNLFIESPIKDVFYVLNKVTDPETEKFLRGKLDEKGLQPIASIPENIAIQKAWMKGGPIKDQKAYEETLKIVEALEKNFGKTE